MLGIQFDDFLEGLLSLVILFLSLVHRAQHEMVAFLVLEELLCRQQRLLCVFEFLVPLVHLDHRGIDLRVVLGPFQHFLQPFNGLSSLSRFAEQVGVEQL